VRSGSRRTSSFRFCRRRSPNARQEAPHRTSILFKTKRLRKFSISDARFALFNIKRDIPHAKALPGKPYDGHTLGLVIPEIEQ